MFPFYDAKDDREMVHLYHFLKNLHKNRYRTQRDTVQASLEKIKRTTSAVSNHQQTIQETLSETFVLEKLLSHNISDQIEGIVEYSVQEMSDEDMAILAKDYNIIHEEDIKIGSQESSSSSDQPVAEIVLEQEQGQEQGIVIRKSRNILYFSSSS